MVKLIIFILIVLIIAALLIRIILRSVNQHSPLLMQLWICPYISRHLLSLNPLQARCRRYSRGER